jgi:citronellol/citronellal dehydrogenase
VTGRLEGKVAVVTGASRGLGQCCAIAFASEGAKVALVARSGRESNLQLPGNVFQSASLVEDIGGEALPLICDISDRNQVQSMIEKVIERFGRIDVLMNNAGVGWEEPTSSIPIRLFEQELGVNVLGTFYAIRAALPQMLEMGAGNIINVAGVGPSDISHLAATKRAVEVLTVGLATELRTKGIAVNCLLLRGANPCEGRSEAAWRHL